MNETKYVTFCIKDISGEINSREKILLTRWLSISKQNRELYDQIKKVNYLKDQVEIKNTINKDTEWNSLYNRIARKKKYSISNFLQNAKDLQIYKYRRVIFALSAIFLFILVSIPLYNYFFSSELVRIITDNGERQTVILPDQSKVVLNSGSKLVYPELFSDEKRSVRLNGEAFFNIRKNNVPFVVESENATITVLGTQFNVWNRENKTRVVVKEGQVLLNSKKDSKNFVQLYENQMSCVLNGKKPENPINVDVAIYLDWMENKLIFEKTPLSEVIPEVERFYNVSIKLDQKLEERLLTARFADQSIETILSKICLVFDAEYSYDSGFYYIVLK